MNLDFISPVELMNKKMAVSEKLQDLSRGRLLVIGDICLDEYYLGDVRRISPEAPVPVLEVKTKDQRLGLAANVAQNVVSLSGSCHLIGVVGDDATAEDLRHLMKKAGVDASSLVVAKGRPTTRKTRLMSGNHHIARVDFERKQFLDKETENLLLSKANDLMEDIDVVVLEDYAKGVFSEKSTQTLIEMAHKKNKKVFVDPHRDTPISYYIGADVFKPNKEEAFILSGLNLDDLREDENSLNLVTQTLFKKLGCEHLVVTLGREGMLHIDKTQALAMPTQAKQTFDVTGAGDTVLATLSLAWASGFDLNEACIAANSAAGVVVGKVGCVACTYDELLAALKS
ncbi:MAG: D-glycero-beta-D-manno-heptose-7-phosphate kinase [Bdellovibrionaceae bacterium]|nr:D-glycero-beta-D-manno-heptose-7-phosphate kinase [Pseudobdellovibrionaceae bacterium]